MDNLQDNCSPNHGKIDLQINNNMLYLNNTPCKKDEINVKISLKDLSEILTFIKNNNRYLIHIINIIYDTEPSIDTNIYDFINHYKTICIDNYGDTYIGSTLYYDNGTNIRNSLKKRSLYPIKSYINSKIDIEYPSKFSEYPLPDILVNCIKNIHNNYIFRSIDYSFNIENTINNIKYLIYYFYKYK